MATRPPLPRSPVTPPSRKSGWQKIPGTRQRRWMRSPATRLLVRVNSLCRHAPGGSP